MKVYTKSILTDVFGKPMVHPAGKDGAPGQAVTLGDVCIDALLRMHGDDARADLAEIRKRHRLSVAFATDGEVELEAADAALIQKLLARTFGPAVVGPACDLLDGQ